MSELIWLDQSLRFPDPGTALSEPEGLLCAGGDLTPERLVKAYSNGIFPWYSDNQPILWWSPNPRCILEFENLHISRSMRRTLNDPSLSYSFDLDFEAVIRACAAPRPYSDDTWITDEMVHAYCELHNIGTAHSIEVWKQTDSGKDKELVGGLYGLHIGSCFFGESMFSRRTNASKYAFISLSRSLNMWGCKLFDCQLPNPHLTSLGATSVPRGKFLSILKQCISQKVYFPWQI